MRRLSRLPSRLPYAYLSCLARVGEGTGYGAALDHRLLPERQLHGCGLVIGALLSPLRVSYLDGKADWRELRP